MTERIIPVTKDYPGRAGIDLGNGRELVAMGDPAMTLPVLRAEVERRLTGIKSDGIKA